jgi:hypothetical protein
MHVFFYLARHNVQCLNVAITGRAEALSDVQFWSRVWSVITHADAMCLGVAISM